MPPPAAERPRLAIKKYPNRRFYDATRSQHVTLEEIYQAVRAGHEVQITDSKRGHDITARVLAQIILELDTLKLDTFPTAMLHQLIRSNDTLVQEFVETHFSEAFDWFGRTRRLLEDQFRRTMGLAASGRPPADESPTAVPLVSAQAPGDEPGVQGQPPSGFALNRVGERLDALAERLDQVQARLDAGNER